MNSLKARLILGTLAVLSVCLGLGGIATFQRIKVRLYDDFDGRLVQRARLLSSMIELESGYLAAEWLELDRNPPGHDDNLDYYAAWLTESGETLIETDDQHDWTMPRFGDSPIVPKIKDLRLPGDQPGRGVGYQLQIRPDDDDEDDALDEDDEETLISARIAEPGDPVSVQFVFARVDTVAPTLDSLRASLIGLWWACIGLGSLMGWLIITRALNPLQNLTDQIGHLKEADTGQEIVLPTPPRELQPVTEALNDLLRRVEKALVRERTLTSNVAHELRTPVAGILSILEVTLCRLRSIDEYRESTEECLEIAKRMHWLVTNLLSVTKIEAGNIQLQSRSILLANTLKEWWDPFQKRATENQLNVQWDIPNGLAVETDPEFLRVVVSNLFDNAVSYTPPSKTIRIAADESGNILIVNQALNLDAKMVEHVFDPFWRKTAAREDVGVHVGLGLNLCQKIIQLLGGQIQAAVSSPGDEFQVRVQMV